MSKTNNSKNIVARASEGQLTKLSNEFHSPPKITTGLERHRNSTTQNNTNKNKQDW